MTPEEFVAALAGSENYSETIRIVSHFDNPEAFYPEEMERLFHIALENPEVTGTLNYGQNRVVHDFFLDLLTRYWGGDTEVVNRLTARLNMIPSDDLCTFLRIRQSRIRNNERWAHSWVTAEDGAELTVCDGLYHANSVSTSLSYIRNKKMYSRQYGAEHFPEEQTGQWSDVMDREYGIFNDLFFDNCDCRLQSGRRSVYGPVTFVLHINTMKNGEVRMTRQNPAVDDNDWRALCYNEIYFTSMEEVLEEENRGTFPFVFGFGRHTCFFDTPYLTMYAGRVKHILVERHEDIRVSERIRQVLTEALEDAGLQAIPVYIRPDVVPGHDNNANDPEELWRIP